MFELPGPPVAVAGGEQYELVVDASVDSGTTDGETVSFATTTMGVVFSPTAAIVDEHQRAKASVIVPYGTPIVVQATTADGGIAPLTLEPPAVSLDFTFAAAGTSASGQLFTVTATAKVPNASGDSDRAVGVPLAFSTSSTSAVFAPATVVTDDTGDAVSHVFVPDSALPLVAVVAGGGSTTAKTLAAVKFGTVTVGTGVPTMNGSSSGTTYPLTVTVLDSSTSSPLQGVAVSFAATAGATCTPSTVPTAQDGTATTQVFVVGNTQVTFSAPGVVGSKNVP